MNRANPGKMILVVMRSLPDINLFLETQYTQDLMYEFLYQRGRNDIIGELLTRRFTGGGNNAYEEKVKGNINEGEYICIVEMTNYLESTFNLIQTFWHYIKKELVTTNPSKRYPKSDVELFKILLEQIFNNRFQERVNGCRYTKKDGEKYSRIETKYLRARTQSKLKNPDYFREDTSIKEELDNIDCKSGVIQDTWSNFVFEVLALHVKNDPLLETMLKRHITIYVEMKERLEKILRKDRKGNQELKSIHYVDNRKY